MKRVHPWLFESAFDPESVFQPEDLIVGTKRNDTLKGTAGDDTIDGGLGADKMVGGKGNDVYVVDDARDNVVEDRNGGIDTVQTRMSYTLGNNVENLTLTGSRDAKGTGNAADNVITGNDGDNKLFGDAGNDTLDGGAGDDTLMGGDGDDSLTGGAGDVSFFDEGELHGGNGNDTLVGAAYDSMFGEAGDDLLISDQVAVLYGGDGNDTLIGTFTDLWYEAELNGGAGHDLLQGGDGDDFFIDEDVEADTVIGGDGHDFYAYWAESSVPLVWAHNGSNAWTIAGNVVSGVEALSLSLGDGDDIVDLRLAPTDFTCPVSGGGGDDWIAFNDVDIDGRVQSGGGDGNDTLIAGDGGYFLVGDEGMDMLIGGAGDDYFSDRDVLVDTVDTVDGGAGVDIFSASWGLMSDGVDWTLAAGTQVVAGHTLSDLESLDLTLGSGSDRVDASAGVSASLEGGDGNDTLAGGSSSASYVDGFGNYLAGEAGDDDLRATAGGTAWLDGGSGRDTVVGSSGNDRLAGGASFDILTGGAGADSFQFDTLSGSDIVTDFQSGVDRFDLMNKRLSIGDGDGYVEGATTTAGPGGFGNTAELVVVTADIAGAITADSAAAAIGSANSAYASGRTALFAVDNGVDTAVYYFTSAGTDALVSASELTLMATLVGTAGTVIGDYDWAKN